MKAKSGWVVLIAAVSFNVNAQDLKSKEVPSVVKTAFARKYTPAGKVSWEKEKGNYEANWDGKSGEDNSAMFTPSGEFIEIVNAMKVSELPAAVFTYVKTHYHGTKIKEAGRITDATGKKMFEAEIKGGDLIFDEAGNFTKKD
jgi:hypothetical protein